MSLLDVGRPSDICGTVFGNGLQREAGSGMTMTYQAEVSRIRDLTHDVRELELALHEPSRLSFKAGQFISFEVPKVGLSQPVVRPYSIASPPSIDDRVVLVFNLVQGGPGSQYLYGLQAGDIVRFKGPAGSFYLREDPNRRMLCVATGTGIAPLRSMIVSELERQNPQPVTLFWGLRYERDLYYRDELEALASRFPRFSFVTCLSRPGPDWTGVRGRVTDLVREQVTSVRDLAVYLCGNGAMIKDVTALLQTKGLCPIYREKYY
ncbi:MAG TPA: FAD-binding oxidoreductase [Nitrospira sp.]|nr:FAD-binding oxidoreductase [Nitrospira sp.]